MKNLNALLRLMMLSILLPAGSNAQSGACSCDPVRDSLTLIAVKESLKVSFWDTKKPLSTWQGVRINREGCVDSLNLSDKTLTGDIPVAVFDQLTCLLVLDFSSARDPFFNNPQKNSLTATIPASITKLSLIEKINLGGVVLSSLPPELFQLATLKSLKLYYTGITGFPSIASYRLEQLEELDLLGNFSLKKLPPDLGNSKKLKWLSLSNCGLASVPDFVTGLKDLEFLGLANNTEITVLPNEIGMLSRLQILNLSGWNLKKLPSSIGQLASLRQLELTNNFFLTELPPEIGFLHNLEYLNLSATKVSSLPETIGGLKNLISLIAPGVGLKGLPESIGLLTNLEKLDLPGNSIAVLPRAIGRLSQLKILSLGYNELRKLPAELSDLENLEQLLLGNNKLESFSIATKKLRKLKVLALSNNALTAFPEQLAELDSLELLYLSNNKIKGAIPSSINRLNRLYELWLFNNEISELPELTLNLIQLGIDSNRLTFDDILPNVRFLQTDALAQKPFLTKDTLLTFAPCDTAIIHLGIDQNIEGNTYRWRQYSRILAFTLENQLDLSIFDPASFPYSDYDGQYVCEVTNVSLPNMMIRSVPINVQTTVSCLRQNIKPITDTLCFGEELIIGSTRYNRQTPSGCEVLKGKAGSCDTLIRVDLSFRRTDTTITDTLWWGEKRQIAGRWYDCSDPGDTILLKSRSGTCDSVIYLRLYCKEGGPVARPENGNPFVPSAFTPNGDGQNDTFDIPGLIEKPEQYSPATLRIFDRFRTLVYEEHNYRNQWDGRNAQGHPLPAGTYHYLLRMKSGKTASGIVTIIR